jgi:hypothetical protein
MSKALIACSLSTMNNTARLRAAAAMTTTKQMRSKRISSQAHGMLRGEREPCNSSLLGEMERLIGPVGVMQEAILL